MKRLIGGGDPIAFSLGEVPSLNTRSDYNSIKDIQISITLPSLDTPLPSLDTPLPSLDTPLVDANGMHKLIGPWNRSIIDPSKTLEELNVDDKLNFKKIKDLLLSSDGTMNEANVETFKEIIQSFTRPNMYGFGKFMEYLKQQDKQELREVLIEKYYASHDISKISP